ncbi:MAG: hypothetical protein ACOYMA_07930 [Bacteroidia bacterium]
MKTTKQLTLICLIWFFSSCSESCPDSGTKTSYVDRGYLPDIIPYSDTSTRLFLKNGKDTLLFKSLGLKETFISGSTLEGDCPKKYEIQQLSLRIAASDTDFFQINYSTDYEDFKVGKFEFRNIYNNSTFYYKNFRNVYQPITSIEVLQNNYDSINIFPISNVGTVYFKSKIGIIKIQTTKFIYELIK